MWAPSSTRQNSRIGDVIRFLKKEFPQYKVCLLTNACGLYDPALRRELAGLDVVIPSLDASNEAEFQKINRPAPGLTFEMLMAGLRAFCQESTARILLELFIVPGVNDSPESVERFASLIRDLRVERIQLNMLDRPGVAGFTLAARIAAEVLPVWRRCASARQGAEGGIQN